MPISGDALSEPSEYFHLSVTPSDDLADGGLGATGTATLLDNDAALPTLSVEATNAQESIGSGFGGTTLFTVTLSEPSANAVSVNYNAFSGTAIDQVDFPVLRGTLTFAPGETSKTIDLRVTSDSVDEVDESFVLELTDPTNGVFAGDAKVLREVAFVLDDDGVGPNRAVHVSSPVVVEGDNGTTRVDFDITLSRPATEEITLNYNLIGDSASIGSDYTDESGTVTFAPGQTHATVSVDAIGDTLSEGAETFFLSLGSNAALADGGVGSTGMATLLDDDAGQPTLSVEVTNAQESIGSGFGGRVRGGL